jgi:hypothetical protein
LDGARKWSLPPEENGSALFLSKNGRCRLNLVAASISEDEIARFSLFTVYL